jgi:hypothetical protein
LDVHDEELRDIVKQGNFSARTVLMESVAWISSSSAYRARWIEIWHRICSMS